MTANLQFTPRAALNVQSPVRNMKEIHSILRVCGGSAAVVLISSGSGVSVLIISRSVKTKVFDQR